MTCYYLQGANRSKFDPVDPNGEQAEDAEIGKGLARIGIHPEDVLGDDGMALCDLWQTEKIYALCRFRGFSSV